MKKLSKEFIEKLEKLGIYNTDNYAKPNQFSITVPHYIKLDFDALVERYYTNETLLLHHMLADFFDEIGRIRYQDGIEKGKKEKLQEFKDFLEL